jgi:glutamyl-tRNA reductase
VLVVGAGKMSTLAARHLRRAGVDEIVVTNRSPERAERLADEIDGVARPWDRLEDLLIAADVVISSTGATEPVLTRPLLKKVTKARRWRSLMIVDIAVPRDADPAVGELEGVYLFDIDDLEKVVAANLAGRARAAEDAGKIVDHEAAQFEQWLRSQHVVPTIRALREHFTRVAEAEAQKTIDTLHRKELTPEQRDEAVRRLAQLVVNKLLHRPQTALKEAGPGSAERLVESTLELFGLEPVAPEAPEAPEAVDPPAPPEPGAVSEAGEGRAGARKAAANDTPGAR